MVHVDLPPPSSPPEPLFHTLIAGTALFRLFDPTWHSTTATSFRHFGPLLRFDHHCPTAGTPGMDVGCAIYYAGFTLSCCVVEVFGDTGMIECGNMHIAMPYLTRDVRTLDLRGSGAMRAGSVAALSKVPDHTLSQAWSRHFHDATEYGKPEGLLWYNAHNDEEALALYERAEDALVCPPDHTLRLDHPFLRPILAEIAQAHNRVLVP